MLQRPALRHTVVILLALCPWPGAMARRLHKRSGYHYKLPPLFEPTSTLESPSAPASHEYASSYYEYKHTQPGGGKIHGHPGLSQSSSSQQQHNSHGGGSSHGGGGGSKIGYSIGSGLRSIAQGSANQAYTAVASQHAAAKQAAFIAQNTLAQAAHQAAATAQTALTGKQVILQELEQQAAEAQRSLSRELEQLKAAKQAANLAQQAAQSAHSHIQVLTAAVNNAKQVADQAEHTANEVANQLASQSSMVGQAKNRLEQVEEQAQQARIDYEATKEAALKASSSAAEAQVNASKAAAHATLGLHESTNHQQDSGSGASGHGVDVSYDEDTTGIGGHTGEGHP